MANEMEKVFEEYPHWQKSNKHGIKIRQKLYEVLIHSGNTDSKKISETVSFFLPFARREAKTLRPLAVVILSRNPCLFLLFLCEG
jgi:hypothetical protein